jgi:hypothetical protein
MVGVGQHTLFRIVAKWFDRFDINRSNADSASRQSGRQGACTARHVEGRACGGDRQQAVDHVEYTLMRVVGGGVSGHGVWAGLVSVVILKSGRPQCG